MKPRLSTVGPVPNPASPDLVACREAPYQDMVVALANRSPYRVAAQATGHQPVAGTLPVDRKDSGSARQ